MRLDQVQDNWERLSREDPLWAICTDPLRRHNRWDKEEFFTTGSQEIEKVMRHVDSLRVTVNRGTALDFGCGIGRLTQALVSYFEQCYGVDIAPTMIELANGHNRYGQRCQYILNKTDNLNIFSDNKFDFIYSSRVLQHMEPRYSLVYIREFIRTLKSNGLLVFQLPCEQYGFKKILKAILPPSLINSLRRVVYKSSAVIEMYTVRVENMIQAIESSGGTIVDAVQNQTAGSDYVSVEYYVTKRSCEMTSDMDSCGNTHENLDHC